MLSPQLSEPGMIGRRRRGAAWRCSTAHPSTVPSQSTQICCADRQAFACTTVAIQAGDTVAGLTSVAAKFRERDQMCFSVSQPPALDASPSAAIHSLRCARERSSDAGARTHRQPFRGVRVYLPLAQVLDEILSSSSHPSRLDHVPLCATLACSTARTFVDIAAHATRESTHRIAKHVLKRSASRPTILTPIRRIRRLL